jgi:Zn-finger nucleic acid-binding protein
MGSDQDSNPFLLNVAECPRCRVELEILTHAGIKSAGCPKCGGVWLSAADLTTAIRSYAADHGAALKTIALMEGPTRPSALRCPECFSSLQSIALRGVEAERCPSCRGVFLDPGESETIAKRVIVSSTTWEPAHQEFVQTLRVLRERLAREREQEAKRRGD